MSDVRTHHLTALLLEWRGGREEAMQELLPLVHDELRRIAKRHMAGERPGHVLQATALVNEAYLRWSMSVGSSGRIARTSSPWPPE